MFPQLLPCRLYSSGRLLSLPNPLLQQRWAESCRLQYPPGLSGVGSWPSLVIFPPLWSISQARLALCRLHSQILAEQGSARAVCGVFPAGNTPALYSAKDLGLQPLEWAVTLPEKGESLLELAVLLWELGCLMETQAG